MNKRPLLIALTVIAAFIVMVPSVSADQDVKYAQPDDISVSPSLSNITLNAGDSVKVHLDIYNEFERSIVVYVYYLNGDKDITVDFPEGHRIQLEPKETKDCVLNITVNKYARSTDHDISFNISINDPERGKPIEADASHSLMISVTSELSAGKQYNKIMGVIDNNLPAPLDSPLATTLITIAIWILIAVAVAYGIVPLLTNAGKKVMDEAEHIKKRWNE